MEATARKLEVGSAAIPEAQASIPPTPRTELDAAIAVLSRHKDAWVALGVPDRIALLREMIRTTEEVGPRWVAAAVRAKRIAPDSPQAGEEWLAGPMLVVRNLRLLAESLEEIRAGGLPSPAGKPYARPGGQVVVPVFPKGTFDKLLFSGVTAEIWMQPDITLDNLPTHQAVIYQGAKRAARVALVLGAGNVASIGPMDALYKLFAEDQVVLLKMNPVNEYLGPFFAEALRPLVERGFVRIVNGGAAEGAYLCAHPAIDEIHITGSDKTHDAIVFGGGDEGRANKAARRPKVTKPITSELGNVSPIIVVPGPWSQSDVDFQGANLASMLTNNAGFNCNATRVIVQHAAWAQRRALVEATRAAFRAARPRYAYYPGAESRYRSFLAAHPEAQAVGQGGDGALPWLLIEDLDPAAVNDICFTTEAFCSVTSEVGLEAPSVVDYIHRAVEFANDTLWGTLNAGLLVHPQSMKDPAVGAAVEQAIADLRFGAVVVNHWPALSYALVTTTWGAFPGHDVYDIRSGVGVVHNTLLYDKPQKSVVRGPFRMFPKPPWFVNHRTAHQLGEKMLHFEASPSLAKLPGVVFTAIRG